MIKVVMIDDHKLFGDGVIKLLSDSNDINLRTCYPSYSDLKNHDSINNYKVLLLDINLNEENGIDICHRIKNENDQIKIIALTMINELSVIRKMINNGANGYLLKNVDKSELEKAIVEVYQGNQYFGKDTKQIIYKKAIPYSNNDKKVQAPTVSKREKQVLELIVEEFTTQEIADSLHISFSTVETHRRNLSIKMGARNTAGLVRIAIEYGLV